MKFVVYEDGDGVWLSFSAPKLVVADGNVLKSGQVKGPVFAGPTTILD